MNDRWYVIYRNESRSVENMITAYPDLQAAKENFRVWARWDATTILAHGGSASCWELVSFPRTTKPRLRKKKNPKTDPDVLEFHDVLDDFERAEEDEIQIVDRLSADQLR